LVRFICVEERKDQAALGAFKISEDPFAGSLALVRVTDFTGTISGILTGATNVAFLDGGLEGRSSSAARRNESPSGVVPVRVDVALLKFRSILE